MEWLKDIFLVHDETFYLSVWSLFLVCCTLVLLYVSYRSSKISLTTRAPLLREIVLPALISRPNTSITYVACKQCGGHAIKRGDTTECLSVVCKNKK